MPHGGPNVPHRTPRKRALEIGTESAGFTGGAAGYCAQCGVPADAGHAHPESRMPDVGQPPVPKGQPSPFKKLR